MALKREFRKWAKDHPNIMTPHITHLIERGNTIIEVSEGRGMNNERMYGVSVAKKTPEGWKMQEGGKPFFNEEEAYAYAHQLKRKKMEGMV